MKNKPLNILKKWDKTRTLSDAQKFKRFGEIECRDLETELLIKELYIKKVCNSPFESREDDLYLITFRNTDLLLLDYKYDVKSVGSNIDENAFYIENVIDKIMESTPREFGRHNTWTFNGEVT